MDMIIRIYFSFNLSYAYLCATDWKERWIKVHMKANDSPQHLLSNTLLSLMKGCCVLSPRAIGSIITSLFWIPTSEVIKYLLLNENRLVLANKSLERHLPKGKEIQSAKSPPLLFAYFPLGSRFREKRHLYDVSRASFSCGKCEQTREKAPFGVHLQNHFTDFETIQPLGRELWILVLPQIGLFLFIRLFQWKQFDWSLILLAIVK